MGTTARYRRSSTLTNSDCDYQVKAILLGDVGVGKTTIFNTYTQGPGHRLPFTPSSRSRTLQYLDKKVKLSLWDTAGQERHRSMTASYYRGVHACVIVFDVNSTESFNNITQWLDSVNNYTDPDNVVTVLVGTVRADNPLPRKVSKQKAQNLASHYQMAYFEVDCHQDPKGLDFVMEVLITLVISKAAERPAFSTSIKPSNLTTKLSDTDCSQCKCKGCCWF